MRRDTDGPDVESTPWTPEAKERFLQETSRGGGHCTRVIPGATLGRHRNRHEVHPGGLEVGAPGPAREFEFRIGVFPC